MAAAANAPPMWYTAAPSWVERLLAESDEDPDASDDEPDQRPAGTKPSKAVSWLSPKRSLADRAPPAAAAAAKPAKKQKRGADGADHRPQQKTKRGRSSSRLSQSPPAGAEAQEQSAENAPAKAARPPVPVSEYRGVYASYGNQHSRKISWRARILVNGRRSTLPGGQAW